MKHLKSLIVLLLIVSSSFTAEATHYMGGEITWVCITSGPNAGKFIFTLKAYGECGGNHDLFESPQTIESNSPAGDINLTLLPGYPKDLSPVCYDTDSSVTCDGTAYGNNNTGAVSEYVQVSGPIQINGVPPASGWEFYWTSGNRNPSDNVINADSKNWYLRAKMYPFSGQNTYPCFDSSPSFSEVARSVISAGYPFQYNHNAFDKDLDSLHFEWGEPYQNAGVGLPYQPGYSYTSPLPGTMHNANNIPATVDPNVGTISFTSYTTGAFVTSVKVSAYKCNQLVAEIWRDIQVILLVGGANTPPTVTPPFLNPATGLPEFFIDTVYAGEEVMFNISAIDYQFLPGFIPQTMEIKASGSQFGAYIPVNPPIYTEPTFSEVIGCLQAPCATLTPAPDDAFPHTSMLFVETDFYWQTDCDHLAGNNLGINCAVSSNTYTFLIKVSDDYCPAPAIDYSTVTIVILPKPFVPNSDIQCLSVLPNGDVDLEWSIKEDTFESFDSYRVFYSPTQAGPYTEIDSIFDINVLNYTHIGANALDSIKYYYVKTLSGCPGLEGGTEPDTFATINVEVNADNVNFVANVTWNATHDPLLASSTGWYKVYRKKVSTGWEFVDSTQNTFFSESMKQCDDEVEYYVTIQDTLLIDTVGAIPHSCISTSSIGKDLFTDFDEPSVPIIDLVTVDNDAGTSVLSWDVSPDGDVGGYIIYLLQSGGYTPIDTVVGINNNSYIDVINDPCGGGFNTYAVAAIDTCENVSPYSIEHRTISLDVVKDICEDKITLTWNSYINMNGGVDSYKVYASENGGPVVLLNSNDPNDTVYEHIGLTDSVTYCYYIVAEDVTGTLLSTSCEVCMISLKPGQPKFLYVRKASVQLGNANGVDLTIHTDTSAIVSFYRIENSYDFVTWTELATLPPNAISPTLYFNDPTANVTSQSVNYRCIVVDSCGKEAIISDRARTILTEASAGDSLINHVIWSKYIGFDGSSLTYQVFRAVDGIWDLDPIVTLPETQTFFNDDVEAYSDQGGTFNYLVTAIEGPGVDYSFNDTVYSNSAIVVQQPRLYIPTAFNPNSVVPENRIFTPRGVFINSADYLFIVYNRWGDKVFEATEVGQGWNGNKHGVKLPGGVYTYFVRFTSSSGVSFEDRGTVTMIR